MDKEAVGMERKALALSLRAMQHVLPYFQRGFETGLLERAITAAQAAFAQQPAAQAAGLTDEEIERLISRFIGPASASIRNDCRALVLEALSRAAPSEQQAEQPAMFGGGAQCSEVSSEHKAEQPAETMIHYGGGLAGNVSFEQPAEETRGVDTLRIFEERLNDLRSLDVSAAFHDIVTMARSLLAAPAAATEQTDSAEFARLQSFLMDRHADKRPAYPAGLAAWALAALEGEAATGAQGLVEAAELIERKAADYADRFGYGIAGSLSFGSQVKMDHYTTLTELAEEIRALAASKEA